MRSNRRAVAACWDWWENEVSQAAGWVDSIRLAWAIAHALTGCGRTNVRISGRSIREMGDTRAIVIRALSGAQPRSRRERRPGVGLRASRVSPARAGECEWRACKAKEQPSLSQNQDRSARSLGTDDASQRSIEARALGAFRLAAQPLIPRCSYRRRPPIFPPVVGRGARLRRQLAQGLARARAGWANHSAHRGVTHPFCLFSLSACRLSGARRSAHEGRGRRRLDPDGCRRPPPTTGSIESRPVAFFCALA